ncbi:unnamed protein product, partial [Iphiclides podalirius]
MRWQSAKRSLMRRTYAVEVENGRPRVARRKMHMAGAKSELARHDDTSPRGARTIIPINEARVVHRHCLGRRAARCCVRMSADMRVFAAMLLASVLGGVRPAIRTPLEAFRPSGEIHLRRPDKLPVPPHRRTAMQPKSGLRILYQIGNDFAVSITFGFRTVDSPEPFLRSFVSKTNGVIPQGESKLSRARINEA